MSEYAALLEQAIGGDAGAAAELWRAIDSGKVDDATAAAWARDVAAQVVAKVLNPDVPANRRAEKARAALGLEGRLDTNRELRALALEVVPEATAAEIADAAGLVIDVGKADWHQIRRKVEYIRQRAKSKKK